MSSKVGLNLQPSPQPSTVPVVDPEPAPESLPPAQHRNYTWAELMKRVFLVDVLQCECCGARIEIVAAIHAPDTTRKILKCLGLPSRAPPLAPAVSDFSSHMDSS